MSSKDIGSPSDPSEQRLPNEQSTSDTLSSGQAIDYNGQQWEYEGFQWVEEGILSLKLKLVGSDGGTEFVREADLQHDNEKGLIELWKTIPRPVDLTGKHEPFRILMIRGKRALVQWTGFDSTSMNTTWQALDEIREAAPELVQEREDKRAKSRAKRLASVPKRFDKPARLAKSQRTGRQ